MLNKYKNQKASHKTAKMNEMKKEETKVDESSSTDDSSDDSEYEELLVGQGIKDPVPKPPPPKIVKQESVMPPEKPSKKNKRSVVINKYYMAREPIPAPREEVKHKPLSYIGLDPGSFSHSANLRNRLLNF